LVINRLGATLFFDASLRHASLQKRDSTPHAAIIRLLIKFAHDCRWRSIYRSEAMKLIKTSLIAAAALLASASLAAAQRGPVAGACSAEIEKYCKGLPHVNRAVRNCLEANRGKASPTCREALDTYGPGRGGRWNR
jgi:hypothetical protein